jgi:hypothetical protein
MQSVIIYGIKGGNSTVVKPIIGVNLPKIQLQHAEKSEKVEPTKVKKKKKKPAGRAKNTAAANKFIAKLKRGHTIQDAALLAGYHPQYVYEKARREPKFAQRMAAARASLHDKIIGNLILKAQNDAQLGLKVMGKLDKRNWGDTKTVEHVLSDSYNDMMDIIHARSKKLIGNSEKKNEQILNADDLVESKNTIDDDQIDDDLDDHDD